MKILIDVEENVDSIEIQDGICPKVGDELFTENVGQVVIERFLFIETNDGKKGTIAFCTPKEKPIKILSQYGDILE